MPSRTCLSSKDIKTFSNSRVIAAGGCDWIRCSATNGGLAMLERSSSKQSHRKPGNEKVNGNNEDRRSDYGLSGGAANALRTPACRNSVVAADAGNNESEQNGFSQAHENVLENENLPG